MYMQYPAEDAGGEAEERAEGGEAGGGTAAEGAAGAGAGSVPVSVPEAWPVQDLYRYLFR